MHRYYYFAQTAMGNKIWWKKYMTGGQLVQFFSVFVWINVWLWSNLTLTLQFPFYAKQRIGESANCNGDPWSVLAIRGHLCALSAWSALFPLFKCCAARSTPPHALLQGPPSYVAMDPSSHLHARVDACAPTLHPCTPICAGRLCLAKQSISVSSTSSVPSFQTRPTMPPRREAGRHQEHGKLVRCTSEYGDNCSVKKGGTAGPGRRQLPSKFIWSIEFSPMELLRKFREQTEFERGAGEGERRRSPHVLD